MTKNIYLAVAIVLLVLLGTFSPYIFKFHDSNLSGNPSDWGDLGSYIGGIVGATFASLSFACLFITVILQRKELKSNSEAQKQQRFEDNFYSLLNQHNTTLSELKCRFEDNSHFLHDLNIDWDDESPPKDQLIYVQNKILNNIELSQYFRILYQLLKFICRNSIDNKEQEFDDCYISNTKNITVNEKMYTSIVRSFVPVKLLDALALNCIPNYSSLNNLPLYRALIERYQFLEHLRVDKLPNNVRTFAILDGYSLAFGENTFLDKKCEEIIKHLKSKFDDKLTEGSYLHTYTLANPF